MCLSCYEKEAFGLLRPVSEEGMDGNIGSERAPPSNFWSVAVERPSDQSEPKVVLWLSKGEALILVLLLSFGLWTTIWGAIALLAVGGRSDLGANCR